MELRNLRTFQAVVDQGSYSQAAETLGYTQSTVTVQIRQLEEELGVTLFERIGRRMALTDAGARLLPRTREVLAAAERLAAEGRADGVLRGTLRVDMAETLLCYRMQPVIRAFRAQAPQVKLILRSRSCMRIAENLCRGGCDLGLGYDMSRAGERVEAETLCQCELLLVAAPAFAHPDFVTPHQFKPVSLIADEPDSLFRRQLEAYLRERDIVLDETVELWSTEAIKRCVMSHLGVAFLPRFVVAEELKRGQLTVLATPVSGLSDPVLCARRRNCRPTPAMELFCRLLRRHLR